MGEKEQMPDQSEQERKDKDRDERIAALSDALLQRGKPPVNEPDMLFDDTGLNTKKRGEAEAAETVAGIDARNRAKAAARDAERAASRAAALEGKTTQERLALRAKWMEDDVQNGDDKINAGQSPDREDETGKLIGTKSRVDVADQVEAARRSVEEAAALGPDAVAKAQKAQRIAENQRRANELRGSGVLPLSREAAALREAQDKIAEGIADKVKWKKIADLANGEAPEEDADDEK